MEHAEIQRLLNSRSGSERIRAAQVLAQNPTPERLPLLLKALEDKNNYVATLAAEALGSVADEGALAIMRRRFLWLSEAGLQRDPGCHVRAKLAFAFGRHSYTFALDALRIGIRTVQREAVGGVPFDTGAHLRANCALTLAQLGDPESIRDIAILLFDVENDPKLQKTESRKAAAQALALSGHPTALIPLSVRLSYPTGETPEVLQECMQAIVALEDPRALETLSPYIESADRSLAAFACLMIAETRHHNAAQALVDAIPQFWGTPVQAVVLALASLRTDAGEAALLALKDDAREATRLALIETLRGDREEPRRACLQAMAQSDPQMKVRRAAQSALNEG